MSDWAKTPLAELVEFRKGVRVDVFDERRPGTAPYLGAASLEGGRTEQWATTRGAVQAQDTDILMLWDGERSGLVGGSLNGVVSSTVSRLRPKRSVDTGFLKHALQANFGWIQARRTGTGVPHVPKNLSTWLVLAHPMSSDEQRRVAELLNALDEEVRRTEALVTKFKAASLGALTSLLTGQGANGRRSSGLAIIEFHGRQVRLPERWSVQPLGELLAPVNPSMRSGPFGSALLKYELVDSGVPLLGIDNVHVDRFVPNFERFVTPSKAQELARYRVHPQDVMITIMGTVGRSCLVPADIGQALSSKHVWTLTIDDYRYRPYLVSRQLNHAPWARAHLRRDEQGGIMNAIRSETLRTLPLPVPPIDEQIEIEFVLRAFDFEIEVHARSLQKLRDLKVGLARDLLSGRVRVPVEVTS